MFQSSNCPFLLDSSETVLIICPNEMDLNVNSISLGYWIKIIGNF